MKTVILFCLALFLGACSEIAFVSDGEPITKTTNTPEYFELPARFAMARLVYGRAHPSGFEESALWTDLAERSAHVGTFTPLINPQNPHRQTYETQLIEAARQQRFNYLVVVRMKPSSAAAHIQLFHVASGGVMATAQAISQGGGRRGFWGNEIRNPRKLDRMTLKIAKAAVPVLEDMLEGVAARQR